ncbi:hypothetical protein D3C85_1201410 [compost metagenome]
MESKREGGAVSQCLLIIPGFLDWNILVDIAGVGTEIFRLLIAAIMIRSGIIALLILKAEILNRIV